MLPHMARTSGQMPGASSSDLKQCVAAELHHVQQGFTAEDHLLASAFGGEIGGQPSSDPVGHGDRNREQLACEVGLAAQEGEMPPADDLVALEARGRYSQRFRIDLSREQSAYRRIPEVSGPSNRIR
jgi:hypothetical protein